MKTDQEILEELKQAGGGGERRRSFGLTAFIVLLAIIIGVFTYMNRQDEENNVANNEADNTTAVTENVESADEPAEEVDTESTEVVNAVVEEDADNTVNNATEETEVVDEVEETVTTDNGEAVGETPNADSTHTDTAYSEAAQVGEGVTHLARRAVNGYLNEQGILDLTAEHKVFVEDYLAKYSGAYALEVGESRTFETSTLDQAITAARALSADQLDNLKQYSAMVPGL